MQCTGEGRSGGLGMHSASTSSLQYAHEEGMNGLAYPSHVKTASVAGSADEAAQPSGDFAAKHISPHMSCLFKR